MEILKETGLALDDLLLVPRLSDIESRFADTISLKTHLLDDLSLQYPIISANMDRVTGHYMAKTMEELGGLGIIHRFMSLDDHKKELLEANLNYTVACIGVNNRPLHLLEDMEAHIDAVLIDVAHGHSQNVLKTIESVRTRYPQMKVIAGNVATGDGAYDLCSAGVNCIKVGVGNGCFAAGTRVLMSNGFYKNIEDVMPGDRVINKDGDVVNVKAAMMTGIKPVMKIRHTNNAFGTVCTKDHKFLCGDLNTSSKKSISSAGYAKLLNKQSKTIPKSSKIKWKAAGEFNRDTALLPRYIKFELPQTFSIVLEHRFDKDVTLTPCYELGYLFGFFLGDGNASCTINKKTNSRSGNVHFYPSINQKHFSDKLCLIIEKLFDRECIVRVPLKENMYITYLYHKPFADFLNTWGKKNHKHLPQRFLVNDREYLQGLYEGLLDSDGCYSDRTGFNNTSRELVELFYIIHYLLFGFMPTFEPKEKTAGGLQNCNVDNCSDSFVSRINLTAEKRLIKDYQIVKVLELQDLQIEIPVYDIEVDCDTHSFIADNAIVHNSVCATRINTGNGVPQATAIIECANGITKYQEMRSTYIRPTLIADGGIKNAGDIVKCLALGADAVMIGHLFAGTDEAPTTTYVDDNGNLCKTYRGQASRQAQEEYKGQATSVEGEMVSVPLRGSVRSIFQNLIYGILSGMSYQNATTIQELQQHAVFIRQTSAGFRESSPHALKRG